MSTTTKNASPSHLTKPTDRTIRIERVLNASRERVWKAFTDPKLLAQWWGRGNKLVIERYELERGGHWRFVEHSSDHGNHGFEGRYREVTPMERLSMTFEWDGMPGYPVVNTVEFADLGDGRTKVVSTMQFYTPEERDGMLQSGMEGGMNESYAALDALLARTK
jgi:uncharacterized protein YndB with AHSA1/START domain